MRFFYNILLFGMIFNVAVYLIQVFGLTPVFLPPKYSLEDMSTWVTLDVFSGQFLMSSAAAVGIGVVSLLFRQNTYALYALPVFAIGVFMAPVSDFVNAIPIAINEVIGKTTLNPMWDGTLAYAGTNPYSLIFTLLFTVGAFFFFMEVILQRPLT